MTVLALDTAVWVGIIVLAAVIAFVMLLIAPWKSVRHERPLDRDIETRLLLGEDPAKVAADADAADARRARVYDLDAGATAASDPDPGDDDA